jgi:hypothetical protein
VVLFKRRLRDSAVNSEIGPSSEEERELVTTD